MSNNVVAVTGNLTADPTLRRTQSGKCVLSFGLAVDEQTPNNDGTWSKKTNYFDCSMFGKRAEANADILRKGTKVAITGKLNQSTWEQDGVKRSKIDIRVSDIDYFS